MSKVLIWVNLNGGIIIAPSIKLDRNMEILSLFWDLLFKITLNYCIYVKKKRYIFLHEFLTLKITHIGTLHVFMAYIFYLFLNTLWLPQLTYFSRIQTYDISTLKKNNQSTHLFFGNFYFYKTLSCTELSWVKQNSEQKYLLSK